MLFRDARDEAADLGHQCNNTNLPGIRYIDLPPMLGPVIRLRALSYLLSRKHRVILRLHAVQLDSSSLVSRTNNKVLERNS